METGRKGKEAVEKHLHIRHSTGDEENRILTYQ